MPSIKIRKDQQWRENKTGTIIEIDIVRETSCSGDYIGRLATSGRNGTKASAIVKDSLTTSHDILRRDWTLIKQAPGAPPPRIALPLLGATPTHCGEDFKRKCRCLALSEEHLICAVFVHIFDDEKIPARLPECLALAMEEER
jgi:hypothetical protein